jgi:chromosome segregation ATPase
MSPTVYIELILFVTWLLLAGGFSSVVSKLNHIADSLDSLRSDLKPLAEEARERERQAQKSQRLREHDLMV